jgi:hypothetical protein
MPVERKACNSGIHVKSCTGEWGRATPNVKGKKKKRWQLQKAGWAVYWRKQKGHASRRTLNKQSLQQQVADSRRQVSPSLRETFTKLSRLPFFFSSFDETTTLDAKGLTETVLHLSLGFFLFLLQVINENFKEMIMDMVNQNV